MKKHLEIKTYTHKGIDVMVKIDYHLERISLVECKSFTNGAEQIFTPKSWVFASRELEYMEGWQNILSAMKNAVSDATTELTLHIKHRKDQEKKANDLVNREAGKIMQKLALGGIPSVGGVPYFLTNENPVFMGLRGKKNNSKKKK